LREIFRQEICTGRENKATYQHLLHFIQCKQRFLFHGVAAQIGPMPPGFEVSRSDQIDTHTTTPPNEWSARSRGRYLHNTP